MNIELLQGTLLVVKTPGLKSTDPRFDIIITLVVEGDYIEAAEKSENIIVDEIYDIRLICYFLYGYWLEQGLIAIGEVLNTLENIILNNWEAIGPVKRREQNINNSLSWIFKQVLKKIQYEERKDTVQWQQWKETVSVDEINKVLQASEAFRLIVTEKLGKTTASIVASSKIDNWLRALQQLCCEVSVSVSAPSTNNTIPALAFNGKGKKFEASYHMELLIKKLSAFEYLVEEGKFSKAALLAEDINLTLVNFDPMLYFPKTFEEFIRLQALNFEELSNYEHHRESPQWRAMQDWLKTDINSFTNN